MDVAATVVASAGPLTGDEMLPWLSGLTAAGLYGQMAALVALIIGGWRGLGGGNRR